MLTLYTAPTANGQRAAIVLEEAEIDYKVRKLDLVAGEHLSVEMLELNPAGRIPFLHDASQSNTVYGSLAIGHFAAQQGQFLLPAAALMPQLHQWIGIIMTDLVPAFAGQFYLGTLAPEPDQWAVDWYSNMVRRFMQVIDEQLADNDYFVGDAFSLVDALMYPTAATSAARLDGGLGNWSNLERWVARVGKRPAVDRGMNACPGTL
jgi:GST-like protein